MYYGKLEMGIIYFCFWEQILPPLLCIPTKRSLSSQHSVRRTASATTEGVIEFSRIGYCLTDMQFDELMPLSNPIQLIGHPAGDNADERHQHEQRPQAETEPAAFRFVFGHGDSPTAISSVYRGGFVLGNGSAKRLNLFQQFCRVERRAIRVNYDDTCFKAR